MPIEASRSAVGVAITFAVAIAFRNPVAGLLASLGALYTGLAASSGVYHARIRTMATSGLMIGSATALGTLVGRSPNLSLLVVFGTSFFTALYASSSRTASTIAAQTTAILCVIVGLKLSPTGAIQNGLLVCSGSAVQLLLLGVIWPMKPGLPESRAVSDVYEALASFILSLQDPNESSMPRIPPAIQIQDARAILREAEMFRRHPNHDRLTEALRRAEAIRAALVGFAQANQQFSLVDRASKVRSHRILRTLARCLRTIGERARGGALAGQPVLLKIPVLESNSNEAATYREWLQMLGNLIQDCCGEARYLEAAGNQKQPKRARVQSLFSALTKLPDIRSLKSVALQHAVRYTVTVEIALYVSQHWTRSHSYWFPVTVAIVLRQDYGTTFQRGLSRLAGTLLGLTLAMIVIDLFHPGLVALQVLTLAMTWFAFASVQASYTAMTIAVTGYVVYSIAISQAVAGEASYMRLVASFLGILLSIASYVLWPAWHWQQIWETLATGAEAQKSYIRLLLQSHSMAGSEISKAIDETRVAARALRIQAENLVEAAKVHPLGRNRVLLKKAEDELQALEENAAIILVAQTEWEMGRPESDEQMREVLRRGLRTSLGSGSRVQGPGSASDSS